jgi:hypothetical protein
MLFTLSIFVRAGLISTLKQFYKQYLYASPRTKLQQNCPTICNPTFTFKERTTLVKNRAEKGAGDRHEFIHRHLSSYILLLLGALLSTYR